ncbi:BQ2448_6328 [Microbotryum intermedium]|uniref:BQ2448_6328 protein n=1 Tax=Microbotryum intermedium TaxID=269621 RepID=A0A238FRP9_9BASI|nr:BQ2448_6328 [Microbotryum intermedium]
MHEKRRESDLQPCTEINQPCSPCRLRSGRILHRAEVGEASRSPSNTPTSGGTCPQVQVKSRGRSSLPPQQRRASNRASMNRTDLAGNMANSSASYAFPSPIVPSLSLALPQPSTSRHSLITPTADAPPKPSPLSSSTALTGVELEDLDKDELIALIRKHLRAQPFIPDVDPAALDRLRRPSPRLPRVRKKAPRAREASAVSMQSPISRVVKAQRGPNSILALEPKGAGECLVNDPLDISLGSPDELVEAAPSSPKTEQGRDQAAESGSKSPKQAGKRDRSQPPRPSNPWILYRSAQIQRLRADPRFVETSQGEISKLISYMWRDEDPEVRLKFEQLAAEAKARHADKYPDYTYRPAKRVRRKAELAADVNSTPSSSSSSGKGVSQSCKGSTCSPRLIVLNSATLQLSFQLGVPSPTTQNWEELASISSTVSWLPSIPSTPAALDASINDLLASINKQQLVDPTEYALDPMALYSDSLWGSYVSSSSSDADLESPASSPFTLGDHLVPLSAPAAFSYFDFGMASSALGEPVPVPAASLSPALLASTPLSSCPSVNSSMASDVSMCSLSRSMSEDNEESSAGTPTQGNVSKGWLHPTPTTPGQEVSLF